MNYLDGFRNPAAAAALAARIRQRAEGLRARRPAIRIMEVCGTHTMAIGRYGIRSVLPGHVELISGPGCPVCVTDAGYIDAAIALARRGCRVVTFGDLLPVPGSAGTLAQCRAEGARVHVGYSPLEALDLARQHPVDEVVFLGIGFETTVGPVLSLVDAARRSAARNLAVLTAFKLVLPALQALMEDPDLKLHAFLCPAHVSAVIGAAAYAPIVARYRVPCVIAGFEPLDILLGLDGILQQLESGDLRVDNQYGRVVRPAGNPVILRLMADYLEPVDAVWRGLGRLPASGLALRPEFAAFDAARKFGVAVAGGRPPPGCRCGDVLKGRIAPPGCALFGQACTPAHPVGPCMVSSEGSCAAHYRYAR